MEKEEKINTICFIVTNNCVQKCEYCVQEHSNQVITEVIIDQSFRILKKRLSDEVNISFYGGEPLQEFDKIRKITDTFNDSNSKISYWITTAHEVFTVEMIDFFNKNKFGINFSFNGYRAKKQKKYMEYLKKNIEKTRKYKSIQNAGNIVFGPDNLDLLFDYLMFFLNLGVYEITLTPDIRNVWDNKSIKLFDYQYLQIVKYLNKNYPDKQNSPVLNFKEIKPGLIQCGGGSDQIAISPNGVIYGCFLFNDLINLNPGCKNNVEYQMGDVYNFLPFKAEKYMELKQYNFSTSKIQCRECSVVQYCSICPVNAALISKNLGSIPDHFCELQKVLIKNRKLFLNR